MIDMDKQNIPFIIAEIGINHNGVINIAKQMIDMAKKYGCDTVKFQKRTIDVVYSKELLDSPRESPWGTTIRAQKEALEFGKEEYDIINDYCKKRKIDWFASSWDIDSQLFLRQYNLRYNKIASPMLTHIPLLKVVAEERKHTFISTGMSNYDDIDRAVNIFRKYKCPFTLMHCNSTYPARDEDLNLSCIKTLRERYSCDVGYSGHEVGPMPSVVAAALGAVAIERHITMDRAMYGSDQAASLADRGIEILVREARSIPKYLGNDIKTVSPEEQNLAAKLRYFREK